MNDHLAYPGRKLDIVHGCSPINLGLNASSSLKQYMYLNNCFGHT
ncbi:12711_t:CDS:2 [Entrophospora sp. SA101]|nr:12711_t:CDS:2 [Entrophospora sp. SA101]